jgi:hypothetical protein
MSKENLREVKRTAHEEMGQRLEVGPGLLIHKPMFFPQCYVFSRIKQSGPGT